MDGQHSNPMRVQFYPYEVQNPKNENALSQR